MYLELAICVVLLIILLSLYHRDVSGLRKLPLESINLELSTGDVIFARRDYVTLIEPMHYAVFNVAPWLFGGGLATHAGVVVKIDNVPYLYQTTIQPAFDVVTQKYYWKTPVVVELKSYILGYPGEVYVYRRKSPHCSDCPHLDKILPNYARRMPLQMTKLANSVLQIPVEPDFKYTYCVQLVVEYLTSTGMIHTDTPPHLVSFADLQGLLDESPDYHSPVLLLNAYANYVVGGSITYEEPAPVKVT